MRRRHRKSPMRTIRTGLVPPPTTLRQAAKRPSSLVPDGRVDFGADLANQAFVEPVDYTRLLALLKAARKDADLVQQELADRLGKPQSFVAKVERGERRIDVIEVTAIARAIGRDPLRLLKQHLDQGPGGSRRSA